MFLLKKGGAVRTWCATHQRLYGGKRCLACKAKGTAKARHASILKIIEEAKIQVEARYA